MKPFDLIEGIHKIFDRYSDIQSMNKVAIVDLQGKITKYIVSQCIIDFIRPDPKSTTQFESFVSLKWKENINE